MPSPADREEPFERQLRRTIQGQAAAAGACLDAETLASIVDGRLPGETVVAAEAHVADCARCQATLAALVTSAPALPPHAAWWRLPAVRWLVPATAVAAAAALWVAVDHEPRVVHVRLSGPEATVSTPPPPEALRQDDAAALPPVAVPNAMRRAAPRPPAQVASAAPANQIPGRLSTAPLERTQAGPAPSVPPAPSPAVPSSAQDAQLLMPAPGASAGRAPAFAPPGAAPGILPTGAARADAASATVRTLQAKALAETAAITRDISTSDPRYRWRLIGRTVQRSTDAGASWQEQSTGTLSSMHAGSAVSPEVCWLVGDAGLVLVTVDGLSWQRTTTPVDQALVGVSATSADAASVTTRDGRTFATTDRGRTWTPR